MIRKGFSYFMYTKVLGWTFNANGNDFGEKGVFMFAPHTSNWDFIIGRFFMGMLRLKPKLLVKSSLFFPPLGWILRALGGIPVDRSKKNNLIDQVVDIFNSRERVYIVFTPEGTRSRTKKWKTGFYYAALKANVPIYLMYAKFDKKEGGVFEVFRPTGNVEADLSYIKSLYYGIKGKHPEKGVFPDEE